VGEARGLGWLGDSGEDGVVMTYCKVDIIDFNVSGLLVALGFDSPGNNVDEALRWALIELWLRRTNG
jgi:hypothetical protein